MKGVIITVLISILTISAVQSQTMNDTILIFKGKYILDKKTLKPKQLVELMKDLPDASVAMKRAKTNYDLAMACSYIGGFCIGYPLGQALAGGEPLWAMAGVGAGMVIIALPLISGYHIQATKAVRIYNSHEQLLGKNQFELHLGITADGLGIVWKL